MVCLNVEVINSLLSNYSYLFFFSFFFLALVYTFFLPGVLTSGMQVRKVLLTSMASVTEEWGRCGRDTNGAVSVASLLLNADEPVSSCHSSTWKFSCFTSGVSFEPIQCCLSNACLRSSAVIQICRERCRSADVVIRWSHPRCMEQ